ncbi:MAG: sodium:proton antiporter [Synergistaceae bacterium]|nr:sodium:proton antiporter [Synergistaceae bacterium]
MSGNKIENTGRKPTFIEALIIVVIAVGFILTAVLFFGADVHIPLIFAATVSIVYSLFVLKVKWAVLEEGILTSILMAMQAILILYVVGTLIGSWILSGVVPTMIYYGLDLISPSFFLIASLIICSIVSISTGTSWGTSGTVGIALMGIGAGLGIPPAVTAGFVISGAYFGDKMSPLSDTTNLAPAMAGTDLFQHIRAMCWTTGPTYIIVIVIAAVFGFKYGGGTLDVEKIAAIQALMHAEFSISPLGFIPPLLVIGLAASKKPAIPSIFAGVIAGCLLGAFQDNGYTSVIGAINVARDVVAAAPGSSFVDFIGALRESLSGSYYAAMLDVLQNGYAPKLAGELADLGEDAVAIASALSQNNITGISVDSAINATATLNELLARGGLQSMNWTVSLILCALTFGGVLERVGFLEVFLNTLMRGVKSAGGLCTAVIISCLAVNFLTGDQYIALVLPGRMLKQRFIDVGLHPRMLSRSLEDSGTLTSVLIPWNTCGAYHTTTLGIPTWQYAPYAFLNWLNPIIAIVMTYSGIGIAWKTNAESGDDFVISKKKPANI